ncbi:MAG: 50S ribosomal protein L13 [archaeon]
MAHEHIAKAKKEAERPTIVVDVTGAILGRVCSFIAKQAMLGKKVVVVNCDEARVSGQRRMIINEYHIARVRGGTSLNGPHFPKHSERLVKRTVRGMLAYTQQRGLDALKRVMCYTNTPPEYAESKKITMKTNTKSKTMALKDLAGEI